MKIPTGAMSVGDILDRSLKLLLARFGTLYGIILIMMAPLLVAQALLPLPQTGEPGPAILVGLVVILAALGTYLVLLPLGTAACLHVVAQEFVDRRVGLGEALDFVMGRLLSILGAALLAGLIVGGAAFAGALVMGCLAGIMVAGAQGGGPAGPLLLFGCIMVGMLPSLILLIWYRFVPQVVVVENCSALDTLTRSMRLTEGHRWRIFGLQVLLFAVQIIVALTITLGMAWLLPYSEQVSTDFGQTEKVTHYPFYLINLTAQSAFTILVESFAAVCWTLCYFDLRIRKEGFDLELAAQQQWSAPAAAGPDPSGERPESGSDA